MTRLEKKKHFIKALAEFLGGTNQARMSIMLSMTGEAKVVADHWAALRDWSPLNGYPTVEEAEEKLKEFLM